jgi:hypothetical protein
MRQLSILLIGIVVLQTTSETIAQPVAEPMAALASKTFVYQDAPPSHDASPPKSKNSDAAKIKNRVKSIGIAGRVTVVLTNNNEYYGAIRQIGEDSFQLADVDLKEQITISYDEVKKVISGFGKPNPFNGKRWHPSWHIAGVAAVIGLTVLIVVAGASASR